MLYLQQKGSRFAIQIFLINTIAFICISLLGKIVLKKILGYLQFKTFRLLAFALRWCY